jgi:hypothetical protein
MAAPESRRVNSFKRGQEIAQLEASELDETENWIEKDVAT